MKKNNAQLIVTAALIVLLTLVGGSLSASPFLFTSPQRLGTADQFWSDADLFLSPNSYSDVEFDLFFSALSFSGEFSARRDQMAQLGFATRLGGLYLALYYGGNGMAQYEHTYDINDDGNRVYRAMNNLIPRLAGGAPEPHNEGAVLIGIADMGFRLSFVSTVFSRSVKDFYVIDDHYESFLHEKGSINPEIAWGMTRNLLPNGIRPHVYLDLDFYRDNYRFDDGSGVEIQAGSSKNHFSLGLTAAAGCYTLFEQNDFEFGADLWYIGNFASFNNEYTPQPGTIVAFKGKDVDDYYLTGYSDHTLIPYLYTTWSGGKLSLSAELGLGLGLAFEKGSQFDLGGNTPVIDGVDFSSTTFSFFPSLDLGMQWAIVSDKFFLNVGTSINFFDISLSTSTVDFYDDGTKEGDTIKAIDNMFGGASTRLLLGVTFNPTVNLGFQAMCGVDNSNWTNSINVFNTTTNGLAVFSRIMATLKF